MSTSTAWALVALCALVTAAIKAAGPIALGGRELPAWFASVIGLMAPALLAALVCVEAFSHDGHLQLGAQTAGVAAGGVVLWRGAPIIAGVTVAAVVAAAVRAL